MVMLCWDKKLIHDAGKTADLNSCINLDNMLYGICSEQLGPAYFYFLKL